MLDILTETFLSEYFKFTCVAAKLIENDRQLFDKLYDMFLLPQDYKDKLYATTQSDVVQDVKTQGDYKQFLRIGKYAELVGKEKVCARSQNEMLKIKGSAILEAGLINLTPSADITGVANYKLIADAANAGKLTAMRILGYLQCEGIFFTKDTQVGCKHISKAAQWNSLEGILMALYYDPNNRELNMNRLLTLTDKTPYEFVLKLAESRYGVRATKLLPENKLLAKSFGVGTLKSEIYSSQYARFLFSSALRAKDKEQLLFTPNNEVLSETADLPLKLAEREMPLNVTEFKKFPLRRDAEKKKVLQFAQNADLRTSSRFRPLCICAESKFMRNLYAEAIEGLFFNCCTQRIDVADLSGYDLEPSKNNIFIRTCNEDVNNAYFMYFCSDVSEEAYDAAKNFLQSDKRAAMRLNRPSVMLNMSAVLPVCFCDRANAKNLKTYCDVVNVAAVTPAEKEKLLNYILNRNQKQYGISSVKADEKAVGELLSMSVDAMEATLDQIVRTHRQCGDITVTTALIKEASNTSDVNSYGFGGRINED